MDTYEVNGHELQKKSVSLSLNVELYNKILLSFSPGIIALLIAYTKQCPMANQCLLKIIYILFTLVIVLTIIEIYILIENGMNITESRIKSDVNNFFESLGKYIARLSFLSFISAIILTLVLIIQNI
jgi:hypothetical protein